MSAPLAVDWDGAVTDGFRDVATFVPRLLGCLLILVVGYFLAKLVAKVVDKLLERAGFDRAVERGGISKALARSSWDASDIVAKLVFFAVFVPVLSAALGVLGIAALQEPLAAFIALIPKILVALALVVIGAMLAGAAKSFISNALGGLSYAGLLGTAAAVLILFGFVKAALDQVGVATQVTTPLLYTVFASVAGVIIVGVGGGLIKPMQSRWESMLNKADLEKDKIKAQASTRDDAYPADPGYAAPVAPADAPTATYGTPRRLT